MWRKGLPSAGMLVIAGCSPTGAHHRNTSAAIATGGQALERVCARPSSHQNIAKAAHELNWRLLDGGEIPGQVVGNGMVRWSQVVASPQQDMLIAVGEMNGTSFCRVYIRQAASESLRQELEQAHVLGEALGSPDFRRSAADGNVVGWHRTQGPQWRAVHLTVDQARSPGSDRMPVVLEMTRAVR